MEYNAMNASEFQQWLLAPTPRPLVMGILNITPDSFSDGSRFAAPDAALAHAREMIAQGADLLDIGGESTRPGSERIPASEQLRRILPTIQAIRRESDIALSLDTTLSEVARPAIDAGINILNDISAGREDPGMLTLAAGRGLPIILMHMQGTPGTMQENPTYGDVVTEVASFLQDRAQAAMAAGIPSGHILLDPGIGFGKDLEHNLALLRNLADLHQRAGIQHRLLVGVSRKRFIGTLTNTPQPDQRVAGSLAAGLWCLAHGAHILRVHDVKPTVEALQVYRAITSAPGKP
jgi:dihydropteroate synthase